MNTFIFRLIDFTLGLHIFVMSISPVVISDTLLSKTSKHLIATLFSSGKLRPLR